MPPSTAVTGTHRYFHASPECWSVLQEVLADAYADPVLFAAVHQVAVDSYAVQHAGGSHPDKSVAIHLVGLHLVLVEGLPPTEVPPRLQRLASVTSTWPALDPPRIEWKLTVLDVALADDPPTTVRAWAEEVWASWRGSHHLIRRLAAASSRPAGR